MSDSKPGDIRLWRMRRHLGEWTLPCDDLPEAVSIIDYTVADGWPAAADITVQRFDGTAWVDVLPAERDEARRRLP